MLGYRSRDRSLDKARIAQAFDALSERLRSRGIRANVFVLDSTSMTLTYRRSECSLDVDSLIIDPRESVLREARMVARDLKLAPEWLNDQVRNAPISLGRPGPRPATLYSSPSLVVTGASVEFLLAMKVRAGRASDAVDIKNLLRMLDVSTVRRLREIYNALFPYDSIPRKKEDRVIEMMRDVEEERKRERSNEQSVYGSAHDRDFGHES